MSRETGAFSAWRTWCALSLAGWLATATPSGTPNAHAAEMTRKTAAAGDLDASYYAALTVVEAGSSDSALRQRSGAGLPLAEFSADARAKAATVLRNVALYRHLPTLEFEADQRVYHHLLQHPAVAVSTWRAMEISKFELRETGPNTYHADARDGSIGTVEVWKSTPEQTVIYCTGCFKSPLVVKPIEARAIMAVNTRHFLDDAGAPRVQHTGDVFVEFPSQTVETIAKLISPVSSMIADRNFKQLTLYVHLMSVAMSRQPGWVQTIVRRMDATDVEKQELLQVAMSVHRDAVIRSAVALGEEVPIDAVLAPLRQQAVTPVGTRLAEPRSDSIRR